MPRTNKLAHSALLIVVCAALPAAAFAHTPNLFPIGYWGSPLVSCDAPFVLDASGNFQSSDYPCTSLCNLLHTFIHLIYFAMTLTIFAVSPVLLAAGGILILIAGANPEYVGKGKKILTGAVVGLVITFAAYALVQTLVAVLGLASRVAGFGTPFSCTANDILF